MNRRMTRRSRQKPNNLIKELERDYLSNASGYVRYLIDAADRAALVGSSQLAVKEILRFSSDTVLSNERIAELLLRHVPAGYQGRLKMYGTRPFITMTKMTAAPEQKCA